MTKRQITGDTGLSQTYDWSATDRGTYRIVRTECTSRTVKLSIVKKLCVAAIVVVGLTLSLEAVVRALDPQEVGGWGERPALQTHGVFGWHMVPNRTTHLRWCSYDYFVQSNALGFPGPLYQEERTPGSLRVLTVGDGFTSAEGVDTNQAWPRLLERDLGQLLEPIRVEVLNFAVTGYGPSQYSAVLDEYAQVFQPDLIIVGFSVNDYFDALVSNEWFRSSIGLDRSRRSSQLEFVTFPHLRRWLHIEFWDESIRAAVTRSPSSHGYFLGDFRCLEVGSKVMTDTGFRAVKDRLSQIRTTAEGIGASVVLALVPAPVQVCEPQDLEYYPRSVDLLDTSMYDVGQPQRLTHYLSRDLELVTYDLREPLRALSACPYQARNRHWLPPGHEAVADFLCNALVEDGFTRPGGFQLANFD